MSTIGRFVPVAAHGDNWQLFMNPSAIRGCRYSHDEGCFHLRDRRDAGLGIDTRGRKHPPARENGAETAIRFMADADGNPGREIRESNASTHIQLLAWV
jgi:hypothetical protein